MGFPQDESCDLGVQRKDNREYRLGCIYNCIDMWGQWQIAVELRGGRNIRYAWFGVEFRRTVCRRKKLV